MLLQKIIFPLFFNWIEQQFFSLVLLNITYVLLFNKIYWKILLPMILALEFFYTTNYSLVTGRWDRHLILSYHFYFFPYSRLSSYLLLDLLLYIYLISFLLFPCSSVLKNTLATSFAFHVAITLRGSWIHPLILAEGGWLFIFRLLQSILLFVRGRVDDVIFRFHFVNGIFNGIVNVNGSPFCCLLIVFHCTFSITYKILNIMFIIIVFWLG